MLCLEGTTWVIIRAATAAEVGAMEAGQCSNISSSSNNSRGIRTMQDQAGGASRATSRRPLLQELTSISLSILRLTITNKVASDVHPSCRNIFKIYTPDILTQSCRILSTFTDDTCIAFPHIDVCPQIFRESYPHCKYHTQPWVTH